MRKKSLQALEDKVRAKTGRKRGDRLEKIIRDLDRTLWGWFESFKSAAPITFRNLDGLIRRRLRSLLRKREKRPGFGRCQADHKRWPNAYFADRGLIALQAAHEIARQPR